MGKQLRHFYSIAPHHFRGTVIQEVLIALELKKYFHQHHCELSKTISNEAILVRIIFPS